jgi:hypothetical protein
MVGNKVAQIDELEVDLLRQILDIPLLNFKVI